MNNALRLIVLITLCVNHVFAAEYFVAPAVSGSGDGSKQNPWKLQTALTNSGSINPGDTVWLRAGTYQGLFTETLGGNSNAPIILRNFNRERAVIDGQLTMGSSGYVWLWGLEVIDSQKTNRVNAFSSIYGSGVGTKLINCLIHDCCIGTSPQGQSEAYGNIMWNCGKSELEHCIYWQNATESDKVIENNILSNPSGLGMQIYGSAGQMKHFRILNNACANAPILVGGSYPVIDLLVASNDVYNARVTGGGSFSLGWSPGTTNSDAIVTGNCLSPAINFYNNMFLRLSFTNNIEYSPKWVMVTAPTNFRYQFCLGRQCLSFAVLIFRVYWRDRSVFCLVEADYGIRHN